MKKGFQILTFILVISCSYSSAQDYGNEWINFSQKYFKLSTAEDGIYRISYTELVTAGFPISSIDPKKIQIYHRGQEQAIFVKDQNFGTFDSNDFIEFYGKKNDGTLDEELYVTPEAQPHKYYNFYSDTTAYFLTWSLAENGKRMKPFKENNVLNLAPEAYHLNEHLNLHTSSYAYGLHYPIGVASSRSYLSAFDHGEGWTGAFFGNGQYKDIPFSNLENMVATGTKPILEVLLTGGNYMVHNISLSVGANAGNLRSLSDISFNNYYDTLITETLEWSDISDGGMTCRINTVVADRVSISYARLVFADAWDQQFTEQKIYHVKPTNSNRSYIEVLNVPSGAKLYDISDENNIIDIEYNSVGTAINAVINNDSEGRKLLLISRRIQVPKIKTVFMREIEPNLANFLIVTNKVLRKPSSNYPDVPLEYATYRASTAGGSFDTLLINIDQLYNMFSYGEYTSLALYRFCRFMAEKGDPGYLFIMGKGLSAPSLLNYRNNNSVSESTDFIPASGFPGADMLFTAGINGSTDEPGFPVGRISASAPNALEAYLDKVKVMESTPHNALWRKELVHLSGGLADIQDRLRYYVDGLKRIAEREMLGGNVITFGKKTNGPSELINIAEQVNAGKMLITFFGHSGTITSDIEIGYVSNQELGYMNSGKYPILLVNGCFAGDMYNSGYGYGEDWIVTPEKGAVGFVAHTGTGYPELLNIYTSLFYQLAFTDSLFMKKGIGDIQKEVGRKFPNRLGSFSKGQIIAQIQQMALNGDPSVSLFGTTKPDYEINPDNVFAQSLDGEAIDASSEFFNLALIVRNFGATHQDSLRVAVKRTLENGNVIHLDTLAYKPVYYQDTLYIEIETLGFEGSGVNQFTISLDPALEIAELSETNNQITKGYKIARGGTKNIFPTNYSIVSKKEVRLVAQSQDLLMDERTFEFELDTTDQFNHLIQQSSIQGTTLAKWTVNPFEGLPDKDTLVFYWRTKFAVPRPPKEDDIWETSSFTFINNGDPGWSAAHYQQFDRNETNNVALNMENREWEFEKFKTKISVKTFGSSHSTFNYRNVDLLINNTQYIFETTDPQTSRLCTDNSMNLVSFDKSNSVPYRVFGKDYGADILIRTSCGTRPQMINNMLNNEIETNPNYNIEKYIEGMGDGDYVLLFSIGSVTYQNWPASTFAKLADIGVDASEIQSMANGEPIIILGKKGENPGFATIIKADYSNTTLPAEEQEITLEHTITGHPTSGRILSSRIGPASSWKSFHQKTSLSEVPATDTYSFNIYGIDQTNNEILLNDFENINSKDLDIQSIESSQYPFLRLEMNLFDDVNLTPPQLSNWIVNFDGVPEGVLSFNPDQAISGNEKQEGEIHESLFAFENVSDLPFTDSLAIEYSLFNANTGKSEIDTLMAKPLKAGEVADIPLHISTLGKSGNNDLKVFTNPYVHAEQNFSNNYIILPNHLTVNVDETNPIMEVTVDGEFIMDGDIVTPTPLIVLRMKDENSILFKEDTLGLQLYINEKCEHESCQPTRVSFSSPNLVWTPATAESDFMVEYRPQNLSDGIYTLRAEAADASGNSSGKEPYAVNFEIINESQITNFFPYPNPFSTRTQFVFTLTGGEIPDEIIIQIMTINGTVVREITQDEIGSIKIGNNKTEYAWDGRDEFGDQLANGVYLYKVKIYIDGLEIKHRGTAADKAFENGIGKMYLLR